MVLFYIIDSIQMQTAQDAYDSVLAKVGAIYPLRDSTDKRIINETKSDKLIFIISISY